MNALNQKCIFLVLFFVISTAVGMEKEKKEYFNNFKTLLSVDIQQKIQKTILHNAVAFLGAQPTVLPINHITQNITIDKQ